MPTVPTERTSNIHMIADKLVGSADAIGVSADKIVERERVQAELTRMLEGAVLEDSMLQEKLAKELIGLSLNGFDEANYYPGAIAHMDHHAFYLLGANPEGNQYINDEVYVKETLSKVLNASFDRDTANAEMMQDLLRYTEYPENHPLPGTVKSTIDDFLNKERLREILYHVHHNNAVTLEPESLERLHGKADVSWDPEGKQLIERNGDTPVVPVKLRDDAPALTEQSLSNEPAEINEDHVDLSKRYNLNQDRREEAQRIFDLIMLDPQFSLVQRNRVDKTKAMFANGVDALKERAMGRQPLIYPSESIFGQTIATKDANDRVTDTHLRFKTTLGHNKRVVFSSPNVPEHIFTLAAAKVMADGIEKPHIDVRMRDPQKAMSFMRNSVDALVEIGYDIDDISVSSNLQKAFEQYKLEKHTPSLSIGEAPSNDPEIKPEGLAPTFADRMERLNQPITSIGETFAEKNSTVIGGELSFNELSASVEAMAHAKTVAYDPEVLSITPPNREVLRQVHDYINNTLLKYAIEGNPKMGSKQRGNLTNLPQEIMNEIFGEQKMHAAMLGLEKLNQEHPVANNHQDQSQGQHQDQHQDQHYVDMPNETHEQSMQEQDIDMNNNEHEIHPESGNEQNAPAQEVNGIEVPEFTDTDLRPDASEQDIDFESIRDADLQDMSCEQMTNLLAHKFPEHPELMGDLNELQAMVVDVLSAEDAKHHELLPAADVPVEVLVAAGVSQEGIEGIDYARTHAEQTYEQATQEKPDNEPVEPEPEELTHFVPRR